MNRCEKCGIASKTRASTRFCFRCTSAVKGEIAPEFLHELGVYWERRLIEGRKKDWN